MRKIICLMVLSLFLLACTPPEETVSQLSIERSSPVITPENTSPTKYPGKNFPCTDSDGGRNYLVKGTVDGYNYYGNHIVETDYCVTVYYGIETFCEKGFFIREQLICESGMACINGRCVNVSEDEIKRRVVSCEDTDGNNPQTKGTLYLTYSDGKNQSITDNCRFAPHIQPNMVSEYICDNTSRAMFGQIDVNCSAFGPDSSCYGKETDSFGNRIPLGYCN